jgi:hypothetical protein
MNCSPGDIAKIVLAASKNNGRMVTVLRAPTEADWNATGELAPQGRPCWIVKPMQALLVETAEHMPYFTLEETVVPDAWLRPIEGDPIADDVTVETPVAVAA